MSIVRHLGRHVLQVAGNWGSIKVFDAKHLRQTSKHTAVMPADARRLERAMGHGFCQRQPAVRAAHPHFDHTETVNCAEVMVDRSLTFCVVLHAILLG